MNKTILRGLVIIIVIIIICVGILLLSFNTLRFHPVYTQGMKIIKSDPEVIALFGSPIKGGIFVPGTTREFLHGGGRVNLETSIFGPKTRGTVSIYGTQTDKGGAWQIESMTIRVNDEMVLGYSGSQAGKGFQPSP